MSTSTNTLWFLRNMPRVSLRSSNSKFIRWKKRWSYSSYLESDYYHSSLWNTWNNNTELFEFLWEGEADICAIRTSEGAFWSVDDEGHVCLVSLKIPNLSNAEQLESLSHNEFFFVTEIGGRISLRNLSTGRFVAIDDRNQVTCELKDKVSAANLFEVVLKVALRSNATGKYIQVTPNGQLLATRDRPRATEKFLITIETESVSILSSLEKFWSVDASKTVVAKSSSRGQNERFLLESLSSLCSAGKSLPQGAPQPSAQPQQNQTQPQPQPQSQQTQTHRIIFKVQMNGCLINTTETGDLKATDSLYRSSSCFDLFFFTWSEDNSSWLGLFPAAPTNKPSSQNEQVFGVSLEDLVLRENGLPSFLTNCFHQICARGLETEGLFRVTGRASEIEELKKSVDGGFDISLSAGEINDVHCFTSLIKLFFRNLPEPLLTYTLYSLFVDVLSKSTEGEKIEAYREVIAKLPPENKLVLFHLLKFLDKVVQQQEKNKMSAGNLAIVFAPNILFEKENALPSPPAAQVVEELLLFFPKIFASELSAAASSSSSSEPPPTPLSSIAAAASFSLTGGNEPNRNPARTRSRGQIGTPAPETIGFGIPLFQPKQLPIKKPIADLDRARATTDPQVILRAGQWPLPAKPKDPPTTPRGSNIASNSNINQATLFSDLQSTMVTRSSSKIRQIIPLQEENKKLEAEKKKIEDQIQQLVSQSELFKKTGSRVSAATAGQKKLTNSGSSTISDRLLELRENLDKITAKLDSNNAQIEQLRCLRNETITKI